MVEDEASRARVESAHDALEAYIGSGAIRGGDHQQLRCALPLDLAMEGLADTPHGLKPDGFSVHRPRQRRDSPKALSAPLDISCRVLVAVQHETAVPTDMRANGQALLYPCAAA